MTTVQDAVDNIRTIALVGPAGAGKTLLVDRLLVAGGALGAMGSVEKGTTASDADAIEKKHGHSIYPTLFTLNHKGRTIHLFDTPGHTDLRGEGLSVLEAVDTAAIVLDPRAGIHPTAVRMFRYAEDRGLDRLIIINKIDRDGSELAAFVGELQRVFGKGCLPLNLPTKKSAAVVDCYFQPEGAATDFSSVLEAHKALVEQVVEVDEKLMERYLETGADIKPEDLHAPLEAALRAGHLIPIAFVSAETGAGAEQLLKIICELMPSPREANPAIYFKGSGDTALKVEATPDPKAHVLAHSFRIAVDRYVGRLALVRLHQGTVSKGANLLIGSGKKPVRLPHIFKVHGRDLKEVDQVIPGDIFAVTKVDELDFDDVLHDHHEEDEFHLKPLKFPQPTYGLAVVPKKTGDDQKLSDAIRKLQTEDRCLVIEHSEATHELVIRGLGEMHLRVVLEEMRERFNVDVDTHPPKIAYRETISKKAEGHHRHKKQTGGAGQFGEVYLRVEPLPRGSGFEFVDAVRGGTIPGQYLPAVEKGVRQVLVHGCVAGYPMQDIRCIVYDGKHHAVDSKEVAFVAAGRKAFMNAIQAAGPLILEPIAELQITAPESFVGAVTGEMSSRRAQITGTDSQGDGQVTVGARAPLSELTDLSSRLRSLTAGQSSYSLELSHYEAAPPQVQKDLIAQYRPAAEE